MKELQQMSAVEVQHEYAGSYGNIESTLPVHAVCVVGAVSSFLRFPHVHQEEENRAIS